MIGRYWFALVACAVSFAAAGAEGTIGNERRVANDGNLVMQGVPAIPAGIVDDLNRYQNIRAAAFSGWTADGGGIYIKTRFGDVTQMHRVDLAGGARFQLTFASEPIGSIARQPGGSRLVFTRDAGGNEFSQIFLFEPATGGQTMLTDGKSRNRAVVWDRSGRRLAYQSTRRNGAANDIWIMQPDEPQAARIALESGDGGWWRPAEFSASGSKLLAYNYVSVADSRVSLLDLDTGRRELLAGNDGNASSNYPVAFDDDGRGYWLITDQGGEFRQLGWQSLAGGAAVEIVSNDIAWDIDDAVISHDRSRLAFTANQNGRSALYLLDTRTREYQRVNNIPLGVLRHLEFSPDDRGLGMTINAANAPSDSFVLALGTRPLVYGALTRWTFSETGGLDPSGFVEPELFTYPTFDTLDGERRQIPAWLYRPRGSGPHPVVISIHGGPESQSRPRFSATYQMWLDKLGVAVILPNVRGSTGYGKTYTSLDNGFQREDSVRDIGALLDWIETQSDLDSDRVAVFGGSYGGYMVLASAVHFSSRLRAAVEIVGISSFVTFLENTQDYRRDLRRAEYGDEREPRMRAHLEKISPLKNVDRIAVPMFIVQGQNDPRVPVTEAEQMLQALRSADQPVWYMNALNEGHGYRRKENRDIYQQATVLFLDEYLLGD